MFSFFSHDISTHPPAPKEGDLYKVVNLHGHIFELLYGYYEDCERNNPNVDPMPIYPDFLKEPRYTPEGLRFVTKMQDACKHYKGCAATEKDCAECEFYQHGDELLGVCVCPQNIPDHYVNPSAFQGGESYE